MNIKIINNAENFIYSAYRVFSRCLLYIIMSFTVLLTFSGCGIWQNDGRLRVCVSIYPIYDFASKIGGDKLNIINLTPGGDVHDFELSAYEMAQISTGDIFIYNGGGLEAWAEDAVLSLEGMDIIIKEASLGIELINFHNHEHNHDEHSHTYDPHIWLYPLNAKIMAKNVLDALCAADSENSAYYTANYNILAQRFDALDNEYREALSDIKVNTITVTHNAFGYMCAAYGFNQIAVTDVNDNNEISLADYNNIIAQIKQSGVKVIFYDPNEGDGIAAPLAEECGISAHPLYTVTAITKQQMQNGEDYFSIMRQNLNALKYALC